MLNYLLSFIYNDEISWCTKQQRLKYLLHKQIKFNSIKLKTTTINQIQMTKIVDKEFPYLLRHRKRVTFKKK